jgi:ubiquinone/menaquinone biosynthesis C-methylase UbiE
VSLDAAVPEVFDQPSLWRLEGAHALGLTADDMIAVMSPGPAFPAVLRSLESALPPSVDVIVDLGAGAGGVGEWLRRATDASVYAIDPVDGARAAATRTFPNLHVLEGCADHAPLPDSFADVVLLSGVISLMTDVGCVFAEADRLLRRSGRVAIADLFSNSQMSRCSPPNIFRSVEDVTCMLRRHGFTTCSIGFGDPTPDASWAAVAQAVDEWIDAHCMGRAGYAEWNRDRRHLRDHVESGTVIGGCIVARCTSED